MSEKVTSICIFTQSPVTKAPRVVKEANVYAKAGYQVTVYGLWYDRAILEIDKTLLHPTIKYKAGANLLDYNTLKSKVIRAKRTFARQFVKLLNFESIGALGYDYRNYLQQLEQEQADVYIGHEEMSMGLSKALLKKGHKVAFDFEDWHSKDLLPKDRVYRPIQLLETLESYLLNKATYCYTTSEAMADAMSHHYKTPKPMVVYNSFYASERQTMDKLNKDITNTSLPSVYWFSQVIGPGRGLELLFEALLHTKVPFQLHLRGKISDSYKEELQMKLPKHINLHLHDLVPPNELVSRIAEHDLGIAFEETQPESRNYTITNKVFHYLQSGIAILATNTAGQKEVEKVAPNAVTLVERLPESIAKMLDALLTNWDQLQQMKVESYEAGKKIFAFENSQQQLLRMLNEKISS